MASSTNGPEIVRVSQKGQATIPKPLREKFGIDAPGEVFVYEDEGRIVVEPVPSIEELHGIHAGEHDPGEVLEAVREMDETERRREEARVRDLVERHGSDDESDEDQKDGHGSDDGETDRGGSTDRRGSDDLEEDGDGS